MKRLTIYFWICTGLLIPAVGLGSALGVVPSEESTKVITTLGYPAYLLPYISVAKLVALLVIFIPKFPRLKEWAYAGLVIDITGAMYSILATGHSVDFSLAGPPACVRVVLLLSQTDPVTGDPVIGGNRH